MIFESVHNYHEAPIFRLVTQQASRYPALANRPELLADVACVALNRMTPRYIRNELDMAFYMSDAELTQNRAAIQAAINYAFDFVQSNAAITSR